MPVKNYFNFIVLILLTLKPSGLNSKKAIKAVEGVKSIFDAIKGIGGLIPAIKPLPGKGPFMPILLPVIQSPAGIYVGKYCTSACCKEVYLVQDRLAPSECTKKCFALREAKLGGSHTAGLQVELLQIWTGDEIEWLIKNINSLGNKIKHTSYWLPVCSDVLERPDVNSGKITTSLKNFVRLGEDFNKSCPNCPPLSNITITMQPEPGTLTCLQLIKETVQAWWTDRENIDKNHAGCLCQVSR